MRIDRMRQPSLWSAELWRRALLIAALRDDRSDPFAAADPWLLWERGLWRPLPMTEQDHADHRLRQVRA